VRVIPRASLSVVAGVRAGALLVRLAAPPVDGAANTVLLEVLAECCGTARRSLTIVSGERSRLKVVAIEGVAEAAVAASLGLERP